MNTTPVTAETITDAQIEALLSEAGEVGDDRTIDICGVAMARWETRDLSSDDDDEVVDLTWPWNGQPATRTEARRKLATLLNEARAQAHQAG